METVFGIVVSLLIIVAMLGPCLYEAVGNRKNKLPRLDDKKDDEKAIFRKKTYIFDSVFPTKEIADEVMEYLDEKRKSK